LAYGTRGKLGALKVELVHGKVHLTLAELTNISLAGKQKHDQTNPPPYVGLHSTVSSARQFVLKKIVICL
jgi:hypothetical protein